MVEAPNSLNISYRPDLDILFCRFVQPVTSTELKSGYEQAFQVAQQQNVRFWLFDLRRRGPARHEDEIWLLEEFFPRVEALSKTQNFISYLISPTHYVHVNNVIGLNRIENFSAHTHFKLFDSEEKAFNWLVNKQTINA